MLPEEVALLGLDTFETINAASLISNKNLVSLKHLIYTIKHVHFYFKILHNTVNIFINNLS